jgi:predicted ester cyclase
LVPVTKKKIGIQELFIWEIDPARGVVAKEWVFIDTSTLIGQLGLADLPHRPAAAKPTGEPEVVIAKNDDAEKANLDLHKKGIEAWNKKDVKGLDAMVDDKAVNHDIGGPKDMDKKKASAFMAEILKAFPDSKGEVVDSFAAGDYVVAMTKNTGTNKGPMPSMKLKKPTGKSLAFTGGDVVKYQGGKAVESWSFYNSATIAGQLGLMEK